ncbi:MAG: ABC transporter permease [Acidobacteriota bacterium]
MSLAWTLAVRLLRRRTSPLLRTSGLAAFAAVALGIASLVVVLALMSGYQEALRSGILASSGQVVAVFPGGLSAGDAARLLPKVQRASGASAVGEVLYLPGLLFGGDASAVVTVKASSRPPAFAALGADTAGGRLPIAIGRGAARRLGVTEGSPISLQVFPGGRGPLALAARVERVFHTELAEIDERWVFASLAAVSRHVGGIAANGIELYLADPDAADATRAIVEKACGPRALVTTWAETNRNLFAALRWQKTSLAILLSLIVGVGAFEVASALVVLVTEKRRQLGILLALGGEPALLRRTMLAAGGSLGIAGVAGGLALGAGLVGLLAALGIPRFPPEIAAIYMVERIPLRLLVGDLAVVAVVGIAEVVIAALLPAHRVGKWEPVEVLRWV